MTFANRVPGASSNLRLLSFRLGADELAVDLGRVREIVRFDRATWLPGFAPAMRGVVELRGEAVLAIDLAVALGLPAAVATPELCLAVIEVPGDGTTAVVGLIVDAVSDIVELDRAALDCAPSPLDRRLDEHLLGAATLGGAKLPVIDLDRLLESNPLVRGAVDLASDRAKRGELRP